MKITEDVRKYAAEQGIAGSAGKGHGNQGRRVREERRGDLPEGVNTHQV
jgi:pyruvate/2-oxoglutarate dehydrogenase complex dihydrolipoamide acyltransferase (E2) component